MASNSGGEARSTIGGGIQQGPVLQGRDFGNVTFVTSQAASAPVARAQLPAPVAGFAGRQSELAELAGLLDPARGTGAVVVSAVAGLAGVGKTALAIQAGHAARDAGWYPGGVLFIDLHGYDHARVQPHQALDSMLRALGVPAEHIPPRAEDRAGLYRSVLAQVSEPVLVIADNVSSEAQVRLLLPGSGPHRVIITSRHTLAGLGARLLDVTVLDQPTAAGLLDEVLRAARPDDDRISADPVAAGQLAGICGGLPLALRITGALLAADPALTAADLAGELRDEVGRLEALAYDDGGGTSAPSVAAAFELSYRQLDAAAALLFRLLPVNPGPDISTAAAAALTAWRAGGARRVIGQLVRAHLVEPASDAGRWRMHDLLRLYARQLSDAEAVADEREQARDRLLAYYMTSANAANDHLRALSGVEVPAGFGGRDDALAWLDAERPNLVAAVQMAASTGRDQVAMELPVHLSEYLLWRRRFDDLLAILTISRDIAHRQGNQVAESTALNNLGVALREVRQFEDAIIAHLEAAAIYREADDLPSEGSALTNLGLALMEMRRFEEAITAHQDAAAIFRQTGDRHREGMALNNLGLALRNVQRFGHAITAHQDAAAIYRQTGDRHREGMALDNLGLALRNVQRFEDAITAHQDAAAIGGETGDLRSEGNALNNLGLALQQLRRFEDAITAHLEAAAIYRQTGDQHSEGMALNNLGSALQQLRRFEDAITAHLEAAAIYRQTGDQHREGNALNNLGLALRNAGRVEEAITAHQEAAAIYRQTGDQHRESTALINLGHALRNAGRVEEAITAHQKAATIFQGPATGTVIVRH
jgi:tetratricopeptide (TPR) repeat protein